MNKPRMILKYPGAKWRIADWIISKMPKHHSYVEPFFGSGAVFFNKKPSAIETINDLDEDVVNLFSVVRNNAEALAEAVALTPYSRQEYNNAFNENPYRQSGESKVILNQMLAGTRFPQYYNTSLRVEK